MQYVDPHIRPLHLLDLRATALGLVCRLLRPGLAHEAGAVRNAIQIDTTATELHHTVFAVGRLGLHRHQQTLALADVDASTGSNLPL